MTGKGRRPRTRTATLLCVACGLLAVPVVAGLAGVRINTSPSMPRGLWITRPGAPRAGDVVAVCMPPGAFAATLLRVGDLVAGGCPAGAQPLLKPVAAVGGDVVRLESDGVSVNGRLIPNTRVLPSARWVGPLPHPAFGEHPVAAGEAWLVANRVRGSLDSRYFGPVRLEAVRGVARPLWLWEAP